MVDEAPCCAHVRVVWTTEIDCHGLTHGWWKCSDCEAEFVPFARAVRAEADAKRLDWLETKVVNVRESTRYGSMNLFWASPTDEDADTSYAPSDLRKQIDAAAPRPATP